jgi:hypothetical protein
MRPIRRISALCLPLVLVVSLGVTAEAIAKKTKTREASQVTVQAVGPNGVTGRVSGVQKTCRAQRQVTLYRVNSGPSFPSSEFVASTWTHGDGSWTVPGPMYPSEFFAVVGAKSAKRVVCGSAVSNSLLWG